MFTPKEAAELIFSNPCERTVRNMIADGRLKAVNMTPKTKRNTWKITPESIRKYNLLLS